ncbi:hypothetical protein [Streptomyces sp. MBT27]|uniref:hypothetical protein n=1 Tax=Streptomyces sp. MBT27 TaxID=1488356 RepID=UPI001420DA53|nr:hypothetical protein [Streptomyces sp. MBT27]
MDRSEALAVAGEAHRAYADGKAPEDCPYDADGDPQERFRAHFWMRGYEAAAGDSTGR